MFDPAYRLLVWTPLGTLGALALGLAALRAAGVWAVPPGSFLALAIVAGAIAAAYLAFRHYFRPANCFLMTDFEVAQRPTDYAGLAGRLTEEAIGFLRR